MDIICTPGDIVAYLHSEIQRSKEIENLNHDKETAIKISFNEIGASIQPSKSISGVNIHAGGNVTQIHDVFSLIRSSNVYAPFGTTTSVYFMDAMCKDSNSENLEKVILQTQQLFVHNKQKISKDINVFGKECGIDMKSIRCHVGKYQVISPIKSQSSKQSKDCVAICLTVAEKDKMNKIKEVADKICKYTAEMQSFQSENPDDVNAIHTMQYKLCDYIDAFTQLVDAAQATSDKLNRMLAYKISNLLNLEAANVSNKGEYKSLYSSYSCTENNYSIAKSYKVGTPIPSLSIHYGSIPAHQNAEERVSIIMFHSPNDGSLLYSFAPKQIGSYFDKSKAITAFSTSCNRMPVGEHMPVLTETTTIINPEEQNNHICIDANPESYSSLLVCPFLYHMAYTTQNHIAKIQSSVCIFGPHFDYEDGEVQIDSYFKLKKFVTSIDSNQESVYIPDKTACFSKLVTKHLPLTFFNFFTKDTAIMDPDQKQVKAWLFSAPLLEDLCSQLSKSESVQSEYKDKENLSTEI